ncbi:MAG: DapH/DapD/GlmU-related protein [Bacilli bacterium]|nr:DapH/DapD/GlmU-related protein [Bacilli bacterium]
MLNKFFKFPFDLIIFIVGITIALIMYDHKYLKSKYFKTRLFGICAIGWKWTIYDFFGRLFYGVNKGVRFPVSPRNQVVNGNNIIFDIESLNNFQTFGSYFQAIGDGKIIIHENVWIAPNVGIITSNHDIYDPSRHDLAKNITIHKNCWIGMNSVILPGVVLGPNTVVGAGSIVTKSFIDGYCVIAGNPAKLIKTIERKKS